MRRTNKRELEIIQNVANAKVTADDMKYLFDHQQDFTDGIIDASREKTGIGIFNGAAHEWCVVKVLGIYFRIAKKGQSYGAQIVEPTIYFDAITEDKYR